MGLFGDVMKVFTGGSEQESSQQSSQRSEISEFAKGLIEKELPAVTQQFQPFTQFGTSTVLPALQQLISDPFGFTQSPQYQFLLNEGLGALSRKKIAAGKFFSGETPREILEYAQGLASQEYGNQFNRLANLFGVSLGGVSDLSKIRAGMISSAAGVPTSYGTSSGSSRGESVGGILPGLSGLFKA